MTNKKKMIITVLLLIAAALAVLAIVVSRTKPKQYDIQYTEIQEEDIDSFNTNKVMTFDEYDTYCGNWKIDRKYNEKNCNYIVVSEADNGSAGVNTTVREVRYENGKAVVRINEQWRGVVAPTSGPGYVIVIPTENDIQSISVEEGPLLSCEIYKAINIAVTLISFVNILVCIVVLFATNKKETKEKAKKVLFVSIAGLFLFPTIDSIRDSLQTEVYKPIIYLYPEEETDISVKLGLPKQIAHSYPKYTTGWKVHAEPDGTLTDSETGRELYSLYYESECVEPYKQTNEGFCIAGKDTICFLEEKLSILGLNEREAEEFIIYWLPKLESNEYNYIRFATKEEIDKNMPLDIQPKPDTTIRVMMIYKGLGEPINVQEQKLRPVERRGYTAVEWGGTFPG